MQRKGPLSKTSYVSRRHSLAGCELAYFSSSRVLFIYHVKLMEAMLHVRAVF